MTSSKNDVALTLSEIADKVGARLEGDGGVRISRVAPIEKAGDGDLSFVANKTYTKHVATTGATALVLDDSIPCDRLPVIRHQNPYLVIALVMELLYPDVPLAAAGCHSTAVISSDACIAESAAIGPHCRVGTGTVIGEACQFVSSVFIGDDVVIGSNCKVYPGVSIMNDTRIGDNVIIHPGAVVGSDGFGFAQSETGLRKIKQIGWVEIGDDVEIGANTTIDRGALGPTVIGRGTKIDNLVQIAHNVEIGEHCIIVGQAGISGSTKLGNGVVLAGQVGVVGHIELGDGVQVGAQSGVSKSVPAGKKIFGYPARDLMLTQRIEASLSRLPDLFKRVRALEKKSKE